MSAAFARAGEHGKPTALGGLAMLLCAPMLALAPPTPAAAEIHDYMILRLVYLGTSCGTDKLLRLDAGRPDWRRFKVECRNVGAYPHGLFVTCTDPADDRSCRIETEAQSFDSLELLQPKGD